MSNPIRVFFQRRKPCRAFPSRPERTTLRVSMESAETLRQIRETLTEWLLSHRDPDVRRSALDLSTDHALRIVIATFARDYGIALTLTEDPK